MLKWTFTLVSQNWDNVNLKSGSLEIICQTKEKLQDWHTYSWIIFENVIEYKKDWQHKYFLARNFVLEKKN